MSPTVSRRRYGERLSTWWSKESPRLRMSIQRLLRVRIALVERRLAAILAADVVGFSRMIGADDIGTLHKLRTLRAEIIEPRITEQGGRIDAPAWAAGCGASDVGCSDPAAPSFVSTLNRPRLARSDRRSHLCRRHPRPPRPQRSAHRSRPGYQSTGAVARKGGAGPPGSGQRHRGEFTVSPFAARQQPRSGSDAGAARRTGQTLAEKTAAVTPETAEAVVRAKCANRQYSGGSP